jgi:two-component system NtrC family sensor kinase
MVFDPFFSTKAKGKGTGLGLWVSYNIIEKMGGTITCKSQPGKGTKFTVVIPINIPEKK